MDRVAIITAAGSGIGAAIARKLSSSGYAVALLSSSDKSVALAEELGGISVVGSNQSPDDLARLVQATMEQYGRIDAVVNSAGHGPKGPVLEISDDDWHRALDVYFLNVVRISRLVTPIMLEQKRGVTLNVSTYATFEPDPAFPTSSAMRSALASYCKLYSDTYAPHNIRMNNLLPGFVNSLPEVEEFRDRIPMERYARVEEIGAVAAFLVSDEAAYITGQNIRADGGITRSV